jgi:hypothetical protein
MPKQLLCYRCGASLAKLALPISRQDECPSCANYLHVCRMCEFFDPNVPKQCKEDDAEEVFEKERLNFCDWFKPDAKRAAEESRARGELASIFGDEEAQKPDDDALLEDAEDLFK